MKQYEIIISERGESKLSREMEQDRPAALRSHVRSTGMNFK